MAVEVEMTKTRIPARQFIREVRGGEPYEYFPLGKYVVAAPGVCGGRPTFKYTRLEVSFILSLIASGETIEQVVQSYSLSQLTPEAVREAIQLAGLALVHSTETLQPIVA
ncbi:MAG: DUF433 domain-containing protein [Chloroflexi bacterium]|nr:DUF433 domain-containing protein [Chloroflexota bacterium]